MPGSGRLIAAALLAASAASLAGCGRRPATDDGGTPRHVVLISIDTCRADHLGCYGYPAPVSPNLDALSRESTLFNEALSPCPLTLPAHCSMLTGTLPTTHGVHDNLGGRLENDQTTLAELLRAQGFETAAIVSSYVLDYRFGLQQGFARYDDHFDSAAPSSGISERSGGEATQRAIQWLQNNATNRCFLFLHYYDAHYPYAPPEPFASQFPQSPYDGELASVDHDIGQVIAELKRLGLYDRTMLVVAGDHGESLGDHGESKHGYFIYQSTLRVPLLIRRPGHPTAPRVAERVGLIDIVPTILASLALPVPDAVQGRDLSGLMANEPGLAASPPAYIAESLTPTKYGANPLFGIVRDEHKFILTTRPELYDLGTDPLESFDLATREPAAAAPLQDALSRYLTAAAQAPARPAAPADAASLAKLRSLGYAGGAVVTSFELDPAKPDPKDVVALSEQVSLVLGLIEQRAFREASEQCLRILATHPDLAEVHALLGQAAAELRDAATARTHFERALELAPGDGVTRDLLAGLLADLGESESALAEYRQALACFPDSVDIRNNMAGLLIRLGRLDEAVTRCREALAIDPREPDVHANLAYALELQGNAAAAEEHYAIAMRGNSRRAEVHTNLGNHLLAVGRLDDAIAAYHRALVLKPDLLEARFNLGTILLRMQNMAEAVVQFQEAVRIAPEDAEAYASLAAALAGSGRASEALAACDAALRLAPDLAAARALRAQLQPGSAPAP